MSLLKAGALIGFLYVLAECFILCGEDSLIREKEVEYSDGFVGVSESCLYASRHRRDISPWNPFLVSMRFIDGHYLENNCTMDFLPRRKE